MIRYEGPAGGPGVCDKDIDLPEFFHGPADEGLYVFTVGNIGFDRNSIPSAEFDGVDDFLSLVYLDIVDDNVAALARKLQGHGLAHAAGASGNNRDSVFQ